VLHPVLAEIQMLQEQRNALVERMERDHLLVTRPFIEEVTPFSFLYEPHTVTALLLMLVTMCYVAFVRPPTDNLDEGVKLCVLCCALQLSRPLVAVHVADILGACMAGVLRQRWAYFSCIASCSCGIA